MDICALLHDIFCSDVECVLLSMDICASDYLGFVDCLLTAYHRNSHDTVFCFD